MTEFLRLMSNTVLAISDSWVLAMVVKATLTLAAALTIARVCVCSRASVRHLIFAATFGGLLVLPLASMAAPDIVLRAPATWSAGSSPMAVDALDPASPDDAFSTVALSADAGGSTPLSLQQVVVVGWILGMVIFSVPMLLGLLQLRRLRRDSLPWLEGQAVIDGITDKVGLRRPVALLQHESVAGPLTCGVFTPTILVPREAATWSADALRRALTHEIEHVRRRDWAIHCLARVICAVYWFHPLVWVSWRQLRLEAERACDDAVVRRDDAREYASLLINVAQRQVSEAGLPILAMARRGDLSVRVAALLNRQQRRGGVTGGWVVAIATVSVIASSTIGALTFAESPDATRPQASERSFDVVSIKRNVSGDQNILVNVPTGAAAFSTTNLAMRGVIMRAYQVKNMVGAPDWVENERYDVETRSTGKPTSDEVNAMLRTMLTERMKLKAHIEPREIPVYALVVARPDHPGLKPLNLDCEAIAAEREAAAKAGKPPTSQGPNGAPPCAYTWPGVAIHSGGITMARFAGLLDWVAGRVVVDRTGLQGPYEFTVRFAPPGAGVGVSPDDRPDLFTALQEQLGLWLEPGRAPVETLVIDQIERPTEN